MTPSRINNEDFPVLDAIRKDVAHPVDLWGGDLHRLVEVADSPSTKRLRTSRVFDQHLAARSPRWNGIGPGGPNTFDAVWIEGLGQFDSPAHGDVSWPVGALITETSEGPTEGFSTVQLVIGPSPGHETVMLAPGRVIIDWKAFAEQDEDSADDVYFADQIRARHGLQTARLASLEQLRLMVSRAAVLDEHVLFAADAGRATAGRLTLSAHLSMQDVFSLDGALRAFLAGVAVDLTEVRRDTPVADMLPAALRKRVYSGCSALLATGAFQCAGQLIKQPDRFYRVLLNAS